MGATRADGQFDALRREIAELRASRERLAMANDAERRSLERALHDGVQQLLVGLAANLELVARSIDADPAAAKQLLAETGRDAQQALEETRRLAHMIYPPLLEAGGLGVALRSAAASADVPVRIDVAPGAAYPPEIAGAVYFCCLVLLEAVERRHTGRDPGRRRGRDPHLRDRGGGRRGRGTAPDPRSGRGSRRPADHRGIG